MKTEYSYCSKTPTYSRRDPFVEVQHPAKARPAINALGLSPGAKRAIRYELYRGGPRAVVITFLAPNQKTGNVAYLFRQTPEQ